MSEKDVGPAFVYQEFLDPFVIGGPQRRRTVPGMSLRAYIATAALQGLLDRRDMRPGSIEAHATLADTAVELADALLAELSKP